MNKGNVKEVYFHSIKMMELCKDIASSLGVFDEEEIMICGLIGLFHDIGAINNKNKFIKIMNEDYSEKSIDILFDKDKLMRALTNDTKYDDVIKVSIYCHNKYGLPKGLNDKMLHFCKVLKDAHAIDDFRMFVNSPYMNINIEHFPNNLVYETFKGYSVVNNKISDNDADSILELLSLIFGINYQYSFVLLKQEKCVDKLISSLEIHNKNIKSFFNQIGVVLNMYIDRKITN
jgi:hypothetical protein